MAWVAPERGASGAAVPPRLAECVWASGRMAVLRATDHPDRDPGKFIADENAAKIPRNGKEVTLQPQQYEFLVVNRAAPVEVFDAQPALVEVFDWWDPHLKQLTFHAGEAWGREERKDVQFLALGPRAGARDDTVAVLDWWDPQAQKLVFHPEGPRGAEERKAVQFYGLAAPRAGTCPVHEFWNERLGQLTVHAGEPWEGERRGQKLFHAYPSWARLRYSAMPHDAACDAAARRVQAALRGRNSRRALPPRVSTSPPSEPPGWLLARPAYAAPLARVGLSRLRRPELVVAVREYMRHGCSNI